MCEFEASSEGSVTCVIAGAAQPVRTPGMPAPRRDGGFAFICLHAATALRPVATKARSVLLASGTLGPLPALAAELGLQEVFYCAPVASQACQLAFACF